MALDKAGLEAALLAIFNDLSGKTAAQGAAALATAIDDYVKTGTVDFSVGQITGLDAPSGDSHALLTASGGTIS